MTSGGSWGLQWAPESYCFIIRQETRSRVALVPQVVIKPMHPIITGTVNPMITGRAPDMTGLFGNEHAVVPIGTIAEQRSVVTATVRCGRR
jgi:hypothetical protein